MTPRKANVTRNTNETRITVAVDLDGTGKANFATGVPFFEHMLDQVAKHGMLDLSVNCDGDNHIDDHHSVEDTGIVLGQAFAEALGDKSGINCDFVRDRVGTFDVELCFEFFHGFVNHAHATLHIDNLKGHNEHHKIETIFKAFGRALRMAVERDARLDGRPASTKGVL